MSKILGSRRRDNKYRFSELKEDINVKFTFGGIIGFKKAKFGEGGLRIESQNDVEAAGMLFEIMSGAGQNIIEQGGWLIEKGVGFTTCKKLK